MNSNKSGTTPRAGNYAEITALVATLHETEQRLEELTKGEVDTVMSATGLPYLLRRAQEELRVSESVKQNAILNALPARIALLDADGVITSVNEAWRRYSGSEARPGPDFGLGLNYPEMCDQVKGAYTDDAHRVAAGIRAVLQRRTAKFSLEYSSHPPHPPQWFLLKVTPLADAEAKGAVVMHLDITERKLAEIELQQTQNLLTMASTLTRVGAWSIQLPGLTLTLSDGARQIHELPPGFNPTVEEATNFYLPEDRPVMARLFANCLRDGTPFDGELQLSTTTGRRVWVRSIGKAERDAAGVIQRIHGSIQDITPSKLAQIALRESETIYRSLAESMPQIVWITRADGWNIYFNQQWTDYTGLTLEESAGHNWLKPFHPDDQQRAADAWKQAVASGGPYSLEVRLRRADGDYHWWLTRGVPIRDATGAIVKWIGTCTDIQEMKVADLALRASEQRFKAVFKQAAIGVVLTDSQSLRFVQANQRFCEIVGRDQAAVEQLTFGDITDPQDLVRDLDMMRQLRAETIREFTHEKRYLRPDGSIVWVTLTISSMWAPGEAPGLCIAFVQDITERRRVEGHLQQAQKMEALGQFSGGVAHDFNNILAAIGGYTELAQAQLEGNPKVVGHLAAVMRSTNRAADLVRQILTFSRQQPQARSVILLQPVVVESMKLMRATIPSTVEIKAMISADAPTVLANANQVHQVLMNLGINAWHAIKDGIGRMQVNLERVTVDAAYAATKPKLRPGVYARVSVSDTGCGMDPLTLRRIFEPFFTTKPPGVGTGLGLSVVHGIMDSHDGAVTVHSQPGRGTEFCLYFPAQSGEVALDRVAMALAPRGRGECILVVDDEEMLAELTRNVLTQIGYVVESTTSSAKALELVRAQPARFALVVTDQTMPGMTGLQLADEIRVIRADLPVMLMTGYNLTHASGQIEDSGVSNILLKPFTIESLSAAVHATLAGKRYNSNGSNSPY